MHSQTIKHLGVTLLEVLLALAIGALLVVFSIRQYQLWQFDESIQEVKENVDAIFQAMNFYYTVNCYGKILASGQLVPGKLNPNASPPPFAREPIDIEKDLVQAGYLVTNSSTLFPENSIVDSSNSQTTFGYMAQFNQQFVVDRYVCIDAATSANNPNPPACNNSKNVGKIVIWKAQVAVLLRDAKNAASYVGPLGGNCVSNFLTANSVAGCASNLSGPFVVWDRSPSQAATNAPAIYWQSNFMQKQFNQMYTTYPMTYLTGNPNASSQQYYLCGS